MSYKIIVHPAESKYPDAALAGPENSEKEYFIDLATGTIIPIDKHKNYPNILNPNDDVTRGGAWLLAQQHGVELVTIGLEDGDTSLDTLANVAPGQVIQGQYCSRHPNSIGCYGKEIGGRVSYEVQLEP